MSDLNYWTIASAVIFAIMFGTSLGENSLLKNDFAQTECAQYSPTTGEFEILEK